MISITGAPRSGTSVLAGALHKLGADLGARSTRSPSAADDSGGLIEYAPVVNIDRDVLSAHGGTWSTPPPFPPGWVEAKQVAPLRDRAARVSEQIPERMVVDDPRLSLVQPLWDAVGTVPATILCLRHPMAVAYSLQTKDQLPLDQGLFLWFRYGAAAILNRPDSLIVEYESLLAEPGSQLTRVAEHIALEASPKIVDSTARTISMDRTHHETSELPDSPIGVVCDRLYALLRTGDPLETDQTVWLWARLITELPWGGPADIDLHRARREVVEMGINVARLTQENQSYERRLHRLTVEFQRTLRVMDEMTLPETAELLEALRDRGHK